MTRSSLLLLSVCGLLVLYKLLSVYLTSFDLYGDEAQYWLWSKNLEFGYYSKPPLLAWVISLVCFVFGNSFVVLKFIPIFLYCATSYLIYRLAQKLYQDLEFSVIAATTFFFVPGVSLSSFLLSTDILLIFFWVLGMIWVLEINKKQTVFNFFFLGFVIGMAFLSKYAAVYFIISLLLLLVFDKKTLNFFVKNKIGAFVFLITFFVLVLPNLIWNYKNGWITFSHTAENAALDRTDINFFGGFEFLIYQILMVGPLLFVLFLFYFKKINLGNFNAKFLICFWFPAFIIIFAESILVRAYANWAAVSLISATIFLARVVYKNNNWGLVYSNIFNLVTALILFSLIAFTSQISIFDRIRGFEEFSKTIENKNEKNIKNIVVGDRLIFSNLGYKLYNKKYNLYAPYRPDSKIANHFQITNPLPKNFKESFILIGHEEQIDYLANKKNFKLLLKKHLPFNSEEIKVYEVSF